MSDDTGVTDICIAINGFIIFAFTRVPLDNEVGYSIVLLNRQRWWDSR